MGQPLADKDTVWLSKFIEDYVRNNIPAALNNISTEELTVNEMLNIADQMQASQQAIDYMRPPPQILLSNNAMTALPSSHSVNVARFVKAGVLTVQFTGFTTSATAAVAGGVVWDGVTLGTMNTQLNHNTDHHPFHMVAFSLADVAEGAHTLQITNAGNLVCDTNDRITAILYGG